MGSPTDAVLKDRVAHPFLINLVILFLSPASSSEVQGPGADAASGNISKLFFKKLKPLTPTSPSKILLSAAQAPAAQGTWVGCAAPIVHQPRALVVFLTKRRGHS